MQDTSPHTQPNILKSGKRNFTQETKYLENKTKEATRKIFLSTRNNRLKARTWQAIGKQRQGSGGSLHSTIHWKQKRYSGTNKGEEEFGTVKKSRGHHYVGKVFRNLQKEVGYHGRSHQPNKRGLLRRNMVIWGSFMSAPTRAALLSFTILHRYYGSFSRTCCLTMIVNLFSITQRLVLESVEEMKNVKGHWHQWSITGKATDLSSTSNQVGMKGGSSRVTQTQCYVWGKK